MVFSTPLVGAIKDEKLRDWFPFDHGGQPRSLESNCLMSVLTEESMPPLFKKEAIQIASGNYHTSFRGSTMYQCVLAAVARGMPVFRHN